jgi:hypothetical protein
MQTQLTFHTQDEVSFRPLTSLDKINSSEADEQYPYLLSSAVNTESLTVNPEMAFDKITAVKDGRITKRVGDLFTPKQVQRLMHSRTIKVTIKKG